MRLHLHGYEEEERRTSGHGDEPLHPSERSSEEASGIGLKSVDWREKVW